MLRAGLDEVGWGALAGPCISVVAVFRDKDIALLPSGVKDSKKTTEAQRGSLYLPICAAAYDVGVGHAWPWEMDDLTPASALQLSYRRALGDLRVQYDELIVDGSVGIRKFDGLFKPKSIITTPKADAKYAEVSAASMIAKFFRDEIMNSYSKKFPMYGWASNKGYGSAQHEEAIRRYGLLIDRSNNRYIHRKSYTKKFL